MRHSCIYELMVFFFVVHSSLETKVPRIVSLRIRSDIVYRFGTTVVSSKVANDDVSATEASFDVTLPEAAFISDFTLEIDGIVYPGSVKEKTVAKRQYETAKKKGQSAGHIAARPRDTNRFKVSVNVAAGRKVTFNMTYTELLARRHSVYENIIYIDPNQIVDDLLVEVFIWESREITTLRVPPIRNDILIESDIETNNELAFIERPTSTSAYIRYRPSPKDQRVASNQGVSGMFSVQYDVKREKDSGDVMLVNGYFVHFFAPQGLQPLGKRILFVLDVSGSMSDRKLDQVKDAMTDILDKLDARDMFNIVTFSTNSITWSPSLQEVTPANINRAKDYVKGLMAYGGTNINFAVLEGIESLLSAGGSTGTSMIVFLTDGEPTEGVTDLKSILSNIKGYNVGNIPIFSLAFGEHADYSFLRKLSTQNNAFARKIYEASDAPLQLTGFYNEISTITLSDVSFNYLGEAVDMESVTQANFSNFFDGSEIIVAGRVMSLDNSIETMQLSVQGNSIDGTIDLPTANGIRIDNIETTDIPEFRKTFDFQKITEKTWAYLTIKQLLLDMIREENKTLREDIRNKTIDMALRYNFVTPVTSMVVTKPEEEQADEAVMDREDLDDEEEEEEDKNAVSSPFSATSPLVGRDTYYSAYADSDPHFIVRVHGLENSVCFDVMGKTGDVYRLLRDEITGVTVNAQIVPDHVGSTGKRKRRKPPRGAHADSGPADHPAKTYIGAIAVFRKRMELLVTPERLKINGRTYPWKKETAVSVYRNRIIIDTTGQMVAIVFPKKITLLVVRHLRSKSQRQSGRVNYLGFYIVDERGLSGRTHGLLGQFLHRNIVLEKRRTRSRKQMGRLKVQGNVKRPRRVMATLGTRLNMATNATVSCWMVQHNGHGLIDGEYGDYLVDNLQNVIKS